MRIDGNFLMYVFSGLPFSFSKGVTSTFCLVWVSIRYILTLVLVYDDSQEQLPEAAVSSSKLCLGGVWPIKFFSVWCTDSLDVLTLLEHKNSLYSEVPDLILQCIILMEDNDTADQCYLLPKYALIMKYFSVNGVMI